jgi:hypothetical protein
MTKITYPKVVIGIVIKKPTSENNLETWITNDGQAQENYIDKMK